MLAMRRESDQLYYSNNNNSNSNNNSTTNNNVNSNGNSQSLTNNQLIQNQSLHHHLSASPVSVASANALQSQFYPAFYNNYSLSGSSAYGGLGAFTGE